jgi:hypothetical protein
MAWIDKRETMLLEDKVYSLFGIFNVCLPVLYGERAEKAFEWLWKEVNSGEGSSLLLASVDEWLTSILETNERIRQCLADICLTDLRIDRRRIADMKGGLFLGASDWILRHQDFRC